MIKQKRFVVISYILLIVIIVLSTLIWQARLIEKQMQDIESVPKIEPEEAVEKEIAVGLVPSRPEDYGMVVTSEFDKPKTQAEWNELLYKKLSQVKSQASPETLNKVKHKIQEDTAKTQEKLAKIDKSIEECREILRTEPDNQEMQAKLERLMILKGLSGAFKDF